VLGGDSLVDAQAVDNLDGVSDAVLKKWMNGT
jgi:hypothetical protein